MKSSTPSAMDGFRSFLTQRLLRQEPVQRPGLFLVAPPYSTEVWRRRGHALVLIPGMALLQVRGSVSAPLVIDERCLADGPWAGTAGATAEGRLAELEAAANHVRGTGDSVIGVISLSAVPDVNLQRLRALYDLRIEPGKTSALNPEPRLLQFVRAILDREMEGTDA